jgi:hypothetical protein
MKMKNIIRYFFAGSAILAIGLNGCTKKIDEAHVNPNAPVRVPVESILPGLIGNMTGSSSAQGSGYGTGNDALYVGRYVQFWATNTTNNQFDQMGGATGVSDILGAVWAMHYYGQGENLNKMVLWATEEEKWDYVGVGHAIRAWSWLTLTNMHGEVILKEAFNPDQRVFKYDEQAEVYKEVRRLCHLAIENLNKTGGNVSQANLAKGDAYFYNGDVNKWKRFTYSVLARSFNQLTNKASEYKPDSVIFYCNLAINSNSDNATVKFQFGSGSTNTGTANFFGPARVNVGALRQTAFIANLLNGTNSRFGGVADPRAPYLIRENTNGTYRGIRPNKGSDGLSTNDQPRNFWGQSFATTAAPALDTGARYIFKNAVPLPIITASEVQFMKAEAYYRKGDKANARAAYINGINLNFDLLTQPEYEQSVPASRRLTPAARANYLASPVVVPAAQDLTLSHIMLQKYIALYGYGAIETWTDMMRYHYTDSEPGVPGQVYADFAPPTGNDLFLNNNGKWVYRARPRYNSEYLYNVEELSRLGALDLDYHTKEQWFSKP